MANESILELNVTNVSKIMVIQQKISILSWIYHQSVIQENWILCQTEGVNTFSICEDCDGCYETYCILHIGALFGLHAVYPVLWPSKMSVDGYSYMRIGIVLRKSSHYITYIEPGLLAREPCKFDGLLHDCWMRVLSYRKYASFC